MLITQKRSLNFAFFLFLIIVIGTSSCKKKTNITPTETKMELLTKNNWAIDRFTTTENVTIQDAKLNTSAKLLYQLKFQFRSDNQVRAIVTINGQIFNGGTWEFTNNEKNILIDIPGLKDEFTLVEITKNKLILRPNEKVFPIVDNSTVVNMEFLPTI